jgi:hypothetical protein
MASGCLTLAHRWDGAEELLPEDCLYFTDTELAKIIEGYCQLSDEARQQQKIRMRDIATQRFGFDINKEKIGRIIEELAGVS